MTAAAAAPVHTVHRSTNFSSLATRLKHWYKEEVYRHLPASHLVRKETDALFVGLSHDSKVRKKMLNEWIDKQASKWLPMWYNHQHVSRLFAFELIIPLDRWKAGANGSDSHWCSLAFRYTNIRLVPDPRVLPSSYHSEPFTPSVCRELMALEEPHFASGGLLELTHQVLQFMDQSSLKPCALLPAAVSDHVVAHLQDVTAAASSAPVRPLNWQVPVLAAPSTTSTVSSRLAELDDENVAGSPPVERSYKTYSVNPAAAAQRIPAGMLRNSEPYKPPFDHGLYLANYERSHRSSSSSSSSAKRQRVHPPRARKQKDSEWQALDTSVGWDDAGTQINWLQPGLGGRPRT